MSIFGAKSRAARGCASKLACGRRIDPRAARPFLQYVAANLPLPNGRTEASAPTGRFAFSPMVFAILRLHTAGSMWASTPTDVLRCCRSLHDFADAPCAGGASPSPTLRRNTIQLKNNYPSPHQSPSVTASPHGEAIGTSANHRCCKKREGFSPPVLASLFTAAYIPSHNYASRGGSPRRRA